MHTGEKKHKTYISNCCDRQFNEIAMNNVRMYKSEILSVDEIKRETT